MMMFRFSKLFLFLSVFIFKYTAAQYTIREKNAIPLHGEWIFAMDPMDVGEKYNWYKTDKKLNWDKVMVPHCFTVDKRFLFYNGKTWYKRGFKFYTVADKRTILHFDAVFYACDVFLNDQKIGSHEGGYTPFSFDVTDVIKNGSNTITVSVDNNIWKKGTIPGARDEEDARSAFMGWMNYGGINRPVYLTVEPKAYLKNLKVTAQPDLSTGRAKLSVKVFVDNKLKVTNIAPPRLLIKQAGILVGVNWKAVDKIDDNGLLIFEAEAELSKKQVKLWHIDEPNLYQLTAILDKDTATANFGIRKLEVSRAQLLLNGEPIRLGGGNRVVDYPDLGGLEPDSLIEKDFRLMKQAGMVLHRLTHYAPSEYFYDLADRYGMLIITEAGNWQLSRSQMADETYRSKFKSQFTEMMKRDWNHPSVFAYSVGNEYASSSSEGQQWTKDMIDFGRKADPSRLFTFASNSFNTPVKNAADEASWYCDFVCANIYSNHVSILENIHRLHPNKPILISEWGVRADRETEAGQVKHITDIMKIIRERPYIMGASWWSFNDFQSRFLATNPNGYRPWGLVYADRSPRPAYSKYASEMSPVTVSVLGKMGDSVLLQVQNRNDFPYLTLKSYLLKINGKTQILNLLKPGHKQQISVKLENTEPLKIEILTPTGFVIYQHTFN